MRFEKQVEEIFSKSARVKPNDLDGTILYMEFENGKKWIVICRQNKIIDEFLKKEISIAKEEMKVDSCLVAYEMNGMIGMEDI